MSVLGPVFQLLWCPNKLSNQTSNSPATLKIHRIASIYNFGNGESSEENENDLVLFLCSLFMFMGLVACVFLVRLTKNEISSMSCSAGDMYGHI